MSFFSCQISTSTAQTGMLEMAIAPAIAPLTIVHSGTNWETEDYR